MRPGAFVPYVMVAVVLLAGCSGSTSGSPTDPGSASDPMSAAPTTSSLSTPATTATSTSPPASASTAIPADVPTTGPNLLHKGERPPAMPELATKHTPAGAVAFAKFFELTIDWGYATTSTTYMKHYYEPSCITCKSIQLGLDNAAAKHRHFAGGRMTITRTGRCSLDHVKHAEQCELVGYRLTSVEVVASNGNFVDADPAMELKDQIWLRWRNGAWTVVEMGPVQ